ncbi:unnamed protein product, partial [Brenthis ino]
MILYGIPLIFSYADLILGIDLEIQGIIDLGPKWSYKYKVSPLRHLELTTKNSNLTKLLYVSKEKKLRKDKQNKSENELRYKQTLNNENLSYDSENTLRNKFPDTMNKENVFSKYTKSGNNSRSTPIYSEDSVSTNEQIEKKKKHSKKYKKSEQKHKEDKLNIKTRLRQSKVKDDTKIHNYTIHIFKQSLKIFENFKKMTDSLQIQRKINKLQNDFEDRFNIFLKQNEEYGLRTNLATHKVILNTIDTANKMMQRCLNYLSKDETVNRHLGKGYLFQKELNKQSEIEYIHACTKLGVCRTNDDYIQFIINILTTILHADDSKIKQASDALTEIVKTSDFSKIIDIQAESKLSKSMTEIESWDSFVTKAMFLIFRNVLINRNKPIFIMDVVDKDVARKTVALLHLIDIINKQMNNIQNKNKWREIEKQMEEWKEGNRQDVQTILERIIKQLAEELAKSDYETKQNINNNIKSISAKMVP